MQNIVSLRKATDVPESYDAGLRRRVTNRTMNRLNANNPVALSTVFAVLSNRSVGWRQDFAGALFR